MSIGTALLPEFDQEMASTRRVLERVPGERGAWKPHEKSFSLGHLAQLVSWIPDWMVNTLSQTALDLAAAPSYSLETTEQLVAEFDKNVREARKLLTTIHDSEWTVPWSLKYGDRVLFTAPRGTVIRNHLNHLIHHRGQLTVYLRLNDVPVPPVYGPTADERM